MRRTAGASAAVALVLLVAGCTTNPVTGKTQLDLIGQDQEVELGRQMYAASVQSSLGSLDDVRLQALVEKVGNDVARVSHRPDMPYAFTAVNDPNVNAYALPGGKIAITRGMLSRLSSNDGLAAVLGHEVGHVAARHVVASYNRQLLAQLLLAGGAVYLEARDVRNRQLIGFAGLVGAQLALAHYSREQERQADELGLEYSVRAGYSPAGTIETEKVLLSLRESQPGLVERLFASHPASAERLQTAEREVASLPPDVQRRPLDHSYEKAAARVISQRPAWDRAARGQAALQKKDWATADKDLRAAAEQAPGEGVLHMLHAVALSKLEDGSAALQEALEGARLSPGVFYARVIAGELLVDPQPDRAMVELEAAEKILPGTPVVSFLQGKALEKAGRPDEAARAYQETVRRDPQGQLGGAASERIQALGAAK